MNNHETTPLVPSTTDDTLAEIASAIWSVRREEEDRCDMELEDLGQDHPVWAEADAVLAVVSGNAVTGKYADTVPKFKFDTLVDHCKHQDANIAALRADLNQALLYEENAVWHWQHDGQDFLESLTCPVVIQASQLRELLTGRVPTNAMGAPFTYSSTQATTCACCGKYKHTPLRVDGMDGYVCLTCIDQRLEQLLDAEAARDCELDWESCQRVADLPAVHEVLEAFAEDPTGDAGVIAVRAVIAATAPTLSDDQKYKAELYDEVWAKAKAMGFENVTAALAKLAQLAPRELTDEDFDMRGSGNKARRRAEALGLTIPGAPAASLVECDACPTSGGCVSTCMKAPVRAAANPDPFAELPDWRTGCAKNFGGTHNNKGSKDSIGNLTCTCGFNWELPF